MQEPEPPRARIVGGPVCTRTADRSLQVNFLPTGEGCCSCDCLYCPCPGARAWRHWPRPGDVAGAVTQALHEATGIESITISGAGEPTLEPQFGRALGDVLSARSVRPHLPVRVVTDGTTLLEPRVRRLLAFADERVVRIDAAGERISRSCRAASRDAVAAALGELSDFSVESVFVDGPAGNTGEQDVDLWIDWLAVLRPRRVYVTTVAEPLLVPSSFSRADATTLERIADALRLRSRVEVDVLP